MQADSDQRNDGNSNVRNTFDTDSSLCAKKTKQDQTKSSSKIVDDSSKGVDKGKHHKAAKPVERTATETQQGSKMAQAIDTSKKGANGGPSLNTNKERKNAGGDDKSATGDSKSRLNAGSSGNDANGKGTLTASNATSSSNSRKTDEHTSTSVDSSSHAKKSQATTPTSANPSLQGGKKSNPAAKSTNPALQEKKDGKSTTSSAKPPSQVNKSSKSATSSAKPPLQGHKEGKPPASSVKPALQGGKKDKSVASSVKTPLQGEKEGSPQASSDRSSLQAAESGKLTANSAKASSEVESKGKPVTKSVKPPLQGKVGDRSETSSVKSTLDDKKSVKPATETGKPQSHGNKSVGKGKGAAKRGCESLADSNVNPAPSSKKKVRTSTKPSEGSVDVGSVEVESSQAVHAPPSTFPSLQTSALAASQETTDKERVEGDGQVHVPQTTQGEDQDLTGDGDQAVRPICTDAASASCSNTGNFVLGQSILSMPCIPQLMGESCSNISNPLQECVGHSFQKLSEYMPYTTLNAAFYFQSNQMATANELTTVLHRFSNFDKIRASPVEECLHAPCIEGVVAMRKSPTTHMLDYNDYNDLCLDSPLHSADLNDPGSSSNVEDASNVLNIWRLPVSKSIAHGLDSSWEIEMTCMAQLTPTLARPAVIFTRRLDGNSDDSSCTALWMLIANVDFYDIEWHRLNNPMCAESMDAIFETNRGWHERVINSQRLLLSGISTSERYDYVCIDAENEHTRSSKHYQQCIEGSVPFLTVRGASKSERAQLIQFSSEVASGFKHDRLTAVASRGEDSTSHTIDRLFGYIGIHKSVQLYTSLSSEPMEHFTKSVKEVYQPEHVTDTTVAQSLWIGCCTAEPESPLVGVLATLLLFSNITHDLADSRNQYLASLQKSEEPWRPVHNKSRHTTETSNVNDEERDKRAQQLLSQTVDHNMQKTLSLISIAKREGMATFVEAARNVCYVDEMTDDDATNDGASKAYVCMRHRRIDEGGWAEKGYLHLNRQAILQTVQTYLDNLPRLTVEDNYIVQCTDLFADEEMLMDVTDINEAVHYQMYVDDTGKRQSVVEFCTGFKSDVLSLYKNVNVEYECYVCNDFTSDSMVPPLAFEIRKIAPPCGA